MVPPPEQPHSNTPRTHLMGKQCPVRQKWADSSNLFMGQYKYDFIYIYRHLLMFHDFIDSMDPRGSHRSPLILCRLALLRASPLQTGVLFALRGFETDKIQLYFSPWGPGKLPGTSAKTMVDPPGGSRIREKTFGLRPVLRAGGGAGRSWGSSK